MTLAVALRVALVSLASVGVLMGLTVLMARRLDKVGVVDVAWGLGFVTVALAAYLSGVHALRSLLLLVLLTLWGGRLAWHIGRRSIHTGEDPRYRDLLKGHESDKWAVALRKVFVPQALLIWVISLPVQVTAATGGPVGWLGWVGAVVLLVGVAFETVGDAQLAAFKADPGNKGIIMDRGLWSWTRHPNYFGDATVWWGIWLIAAQHWPGLLTIVCPAVMTWFLVRGTGAKLTEQIMADRPGYAGYQERTSGFFPLPPKRA